VHEAYARLVDADISWEDRVHFFAVASGTMRRVLVDHARARSAAKRGGGSVGITLHEGLLSGDAPDDRLLELDEAWTAWPGSTRGRRRRWNSATSGA
jgi:RNA polymerase sigma-70 factor, ECF subfamily